MKIPRLVESFQAAGEVQPSCSECNRIRVLCILISRTEYQRDNCSGEVCEAKEIHRERKADEKHVRKTCREKSSRE